MFFSKSTGGFYHPDIHQDIPADAVEISDDEYKMLLASGKQILGSSSGHPVLSDKSAPLALSRTDAAQMITAGLARTLKAVATKYNYSSVEEACGFNDGPFAKDGAFFRKLRDEARAQLLEQLDRLTDVQDISVVAAILKELRDTVTSMVQSAGVANG